MTIRPHESPDTFVTALPNGVRVLVLRLPHLATASASVFVRSGSAHETRTTNGISHLVEHMAFKGTATRDARRINLDAERLGAEVNAHTDKDHTAFQMRGLAEHALPFVRMLGDIVLQPSFPADELERERQVVLHEFADDEDDPMSAAYRLFDHACFGLHPAAQAVIGQRRNVERLSRDDLLRYVQRQYSGANVVVGVAGPVDPDAVTREVQAVFGALPGGAPNTVEVPAYAGGVRTRRFAGSSLAHVVLGFGVPPLRDDDATAQVAAAVFGEGMSSPLLQRVREQRALAYHAHCAADVLDMCGQFVVEASTAPEMLDDYLREVAALLAAHARRVDADDLERAHRQLAVRQLRADERPMQRLEDAALDLFTHGRVRSSAERRARLDAVGAEAVRTAFERMLVQGVAAALVGPLGRAAGERAREILGGLHTGH